MRIIGIDPGYAIVGYSIIDFIKNKRILCECGVIETPAKDEFPNRLIKIYDELNLILEKFHPDCASVEQEVQSLVCRWRRCPEHLQFPRRQH